jgi:type IV secretion system protein VirD4
LSTSGTSHEHDHNATDDHSDTGENPYTEWERDANTYLLSVRVGAAVTASSDRQRDPQPVSTGWEVPVAVIGGVVIAVSLAALFGVALASTVWGGGWVWPHGADIAARVLGGVVTGHPRRGYPPAQAPLVAAPAAVYVCVAISELVLVGVAIMTAVLVIRLRRPGGAGAGMATRSEAREVLGRGTLRQARAIIRPDLYGPYASTEPAAAAAARATAEPMVGGAPVRGFDPADVGWRLGRSESPRGVELWCRFDRTTGVYGEQGSGKTLDVLAPALLAHRGAAMATLTKVDDLLLTCGRRQLPITPGGKRRPVAVLDPFGAAPGMPEFVWDPVAGCVDPKIAEKRAKAFAAGTVTGSVSGGRQDSAARFYAAETAKVLQGFLHAAALTGRSIEHVLEWVANPIAAELPAEILQQHPHAARFWDGLLGGALHGSPETVGNTVTTVQQAMALFFQPEIRARCIPTHDRPVTDLVDLIERCGTVYLLGREDPYASAAPLMTAVAEHVLDTALEVAVTSRHGRMTPCFLACLDELPSTTPLPTLRVRMANERALGLSFLYAAQTWRQMVVSYGEDEARSLFGLTNTLVIFGGGKDIHFYKEISELIDDVRITRQSISDGPGGIGTSRRGEDVRVLPPGDIRRIRERHALVIAGNAPPIIAGLRRCLDGPDGATLAAELDAARVKMAASRSHTQTVADRTRSAVSYARDNGLIPPHVGTAHGAVPHPGTGTSETPERDTLDDQNPESEL